MKQFVLPEGYAGDSTLDLTGDDFHYLCTVRRYGEGDSFPALTRDGRAFTASIVRKTRDRCRIALTERSAEAPDTPFLTLYQCLPKAAKMDQIVRQATESGVRRVVPTISDHTVPNIEGKVEKKMSRWDRIAEEAVQQSRAPIVPEISRPTAIADLADLRRDGELGLYFDSDAEKAESLHRHLSDHDGPIGVLIGPEGGLSDNDRMILEGQGFRRAFLGRQVLRTETAAVYAVAAIQIIALEKDQWSTRPG